MKRRMFVPGLLASLFGGCQATLDSTTPQEPASISIALSANTLTLRVGSTSPVLQIALTRNAAATAPVSLSVSGLPPGVRATLTPTLMVGSDRIATLELLATATANPGTSLITIKAETGNLLVQAPVGVTVTP